MISSTGIVGGPSVGFCVAALAGAFCGGAAAVGFGCVSLGDLVSAGAEPMGPCCRAASGRNAQTAAKQVDRIIVASRRRLPARWDRMSAITCSPQDIPCVFCDF